MSGLTRPSALSSVRADLDVFEAEWLDGLHANGLGRGEPDRRADRRKSLRPDSGMKAASSSRSTPTTPQSRCVSAYGN
jgi:hypothetical protein